MHQAIVKVLGFDILWKGMGKTQNTPFQTHFMKVKDTFDCF